MSESLRGHFLVSSNQLRDPNFYRTVIFVLEDNQDGAMGLVINRPSSLTVDSAFAQVEKPTASSAPIFSGGPVETTALFILHNCPELGVDDEHVVDSIFLTGSNDSFEALVSDDQSCDHSCGFRVYCGYAGWGKQQLADEIERGDWFVLEGDQPTVFEIDPYAVWESCLRRLQESKRILPNMPNNPEWN